MLARTLSRQLYRRGGPVLLMRLGALPKHGGVIVCATTACLRARLRTAPIRSRGRQRADAQLLMTFCLAPEADRASSLARLPMTCPNPGSSIHFRSDLLKRGSSGERPYLGTCRRVCDVEVDADAEPRTSESGCRPDANAPALLRSRLCLTYSYARVLSVGRCFHESLTSPSRTLARRAHWLDSRRMVEFEEFRRTAAYVRRILRVQTESVQYESGPGVSVPQRAARRSAG